MFAAQAVSVSDYVSKVILIGINISNRGHRKRLFSFSTCLETQHLDVVKNSVLLLIINLVFFDFTLLPVITAFTHQEELTKSVKRN